MARTEETIFAQEETIFAREETIFARKGRDVFRAEKIAFASRLVYNRLSRIFGRRLI